MAATQVLRIWCVLLVLVLPWTAEGEGHCDPSCHVCELWLEASARLTMMQPYDGGLVVAKEGVLYPYDGIGNWSREVDMDDVVTANGWHTPRVLNLFNDSLPGPTLIVYEGQEVILHVCNRLLSESVSLHIHGLWQQGTPWMDGVAFLTQCPVLPGQTYTYRFQVKQFGTYWYHSHIGLQIPMGMYGAFIIRQRHEHNQAEDPIGGEKKSCVCGGGPNEWMRKGYSGVRREEEYEQMLEAEEMEKQKESVGADSERDGKPAAADHSSKEPKYLKVEGRPPILRTAPPHDNSDIGTYHTHQEFVFTASSYNHEWDAMTDFLHMYQGIYVNGTLLNSPRAYDGAYYSPQKFNSILINGRGRYRNPETGKITESPLHTFTVRPETWIRFRCIGVETQIPFEISIDEHILYVVALDGMDIRNVAAHSVVISPGERVDFYILTGMDVKNYWIRATPLVVDHESNHGEAVLNYEGAEKKLPCSVKRECTEEEPCVVLNCPLKHFPKKMRKRCIHVNDLRNDHDQKLEKVDKEVFLNFMLHPRWSRMNSINGRAFEMPTVAALIQPNEAPAECGDKPCYAVDGYPTPCRCYHTLDFKFGQTIQLVLTNLGIWNRAVHPVHLHGHHFQVIKIGYGETDLETGHLIRDSPDIHCAGHNRDMAVGCVNATWRNHTWDADHLPGANMQNPPLKDTIIVPSGGYVVLRFKADNPGLWFLHCHTSAHYVTGMAMVMKEALERIPEPPKDLPRCSSFRR